MYGYKNEIAEKLLSCWKTGDLLLNFERELFGRLSRIAFLGNFDYHNIDSMKPLVSFLEIIGNSLSWLKGFEAFHGNTGKVSEYILAAIIGGDETIPFGVVKPFNRTFCHK